MTSSRAQHGAHRERVCPWDLSRDEFCGSVYFFAPIGKFETQRHRDTESFGNLARGYRSFLLITRSIPGGEFSLTYISFTPTLRVLCASVFPKSARRVLKHRDTEAQSLLEIWCNCRWLRTHKNVGFSSRGKNFGKYLGILD